MTTQSQKVDSVALPFPGARTAIERAAIRPQAVKILRRDDLSDAVKREILTPPSLETSNR